MNKLLNFNNDNVKFRVVSELVIFMFRKTIGILICLLIALNSAVSQSADKFYISGKVRVEQGLVEGATIQIFRNGAFLNNVSINRTGNFRVPVDLGQLYRFNFTKEGAYSKTIEIDTRIPDNICDIDCSFPPYQVVVMLYQKVPGVAEVEADIPRISYNPAIDNFDAEAMREAASITGHMDKMLSDVKQQSERYERESAQLKQKNYQDALKEADQYKSRKLYEQAMHRYRDALLIYPNQVHPREQVTNMFELLINEELNASLGPAINENLLKYINYGDQMLAKNEFTIAKVAFERALSISPNDQNVRSKLIRVQQEVSNIQQLALNEVAQYQKVYEARTRKYNELIKQGDEKFKKELIADARDLYSQAATQIDERSYAVLMVTKIDELMSDDELAQRLAKEREDADKKRLLEARNKAYDDAIAEADQMFSQRLYHDAIEYYELALSIKNYELYPQNQIRNIRNLLAKLQLVGEEYNRIIREADALFNASSYMEARIKFELAHSMIPNEKYALLKIEEIDRILRRTNIEAEVDLKYNALLDKADTLFNNKKYQESIVVYQDAVVLKPNEKYPTDQIRKIREILSRESDAQKRLNQQRVDYDRTIGLADNAFRQESYQTARSLYHEALRILPGQVYPQSQITEIDRILKKQEEALKQVSILEKIDFTNLQNVAQSDREAAYKEAMALGHQFMGTKEWGIARFYFRRALALMPGDTAATAKINEVEAIIRGDNANDVKYEEMIQRADEAFKTGDFNVARFYYIKAREAKPDDEYVNERVQVTTQLVESSSARITNREYDASMSKANEALELKNYSVARFFYRKALSHKPNDEQAKLKLYEVEQLIRQQ